MQRDEERALRRDVLHRQADAGHITDLSKSAWSPAGLSHADVARSRRRRVISAVEPDVTTPTLLYPSL